MRTSLAPALSIFALACGAAPHPIERPLHAERIVDAPSAPLFVSHAALTLRSASASTAAPPFYAELAADGSVAGTRCNATRLTDDGALEREGVVVARIVRAGDALVLQTADGAELGWRIESGALTTHAGTRFTLDAGAITTTDAELPAIAVVPPSTPSEIALGFFAALLVCDDVGP